MFNFEIRLSDNRLELYDQKGIKVHASSETLEVNYVNNLEVIVLTTKPVEFRIIKTSG
jgi:hypothetical protein